MVISANRLAGTFLVLAMGFAGLPGFAGDGKPSPSPPDEGEPSETDPFPDTASFPPYGIHQIGFDAKYLVTRPAHWDRKGWGKVAMIAGATLGLYLLRDEIREEVLEHRSPGRTDFLDDVRTMGKGAIAPSLALIAYISSFATGKDREKETALLLMESMAYSAVGAFAGSFILSTERPDEGDTIAFFQSGGHGVSLDTALAFSVIPPLRRQYLMTRPEDGKGKKFWKRTASGFLYLGAGLTGYQRMYADKHWAPDVFLGAVTGLVVGNTLSDAHAASKGQSQGRHQVTFNPGGVVWTIRLGSHKNRGAVTESGD